MASVDFYYEGSNITVHCHKNERMSQIFQRFITKSNINSNSVVYLYNGTAVSDKELTFNELSNPDDKIRNKMSIVVTNSPQSSPFQFQFLKLYEADESMKDFVKMSILLAYQEYPDNLPKRAELIKSKFEERYGGKWICIIFKDGYGAANGFYYNMIFLKYGDYKISIGKTER